MMSTTSATRLFIRLSGMHLLSGAGCELLEIASHTAARQLWWTC